MATFPALRNPAWLRRNATTVVQATVYGGVDKLHIVSGTLTVYTASGSVHSTPAVTVSGNVASASVIIGEVDPERGWRLEWSLSDGSDYYCTQSAVIVRNPPACPVSSADVTAMQPRTLGTVYPGSQTSWDPQIELAFAEVCSTLLQATGVTLDRVTDPSVLFPLVLRRALVLALEIAQGPSGKLADLAATYQAQYADMLRMLAVPIDDDGDGVADRSRSGAAAGWTVDGRVG